MACRQAKKIRHGPSSLPGDQLQPCHVDFIKIRELLSIHLDANEMLIEQLGNFHIVEAFNLHHMTQWQVE